jgi:hypothetical protein
MFMPTLKNLEVISGRMDFEGYATQEGILE